MLQLKLLQLLEIGVTSIAPEKNQKATQNQTTRKL